MFEILESYPLLLLTLLVVVGSLLGQIKIAGATLGPAAVLFTAIGLTAWGVSNGVELTIPEVLGSFGLIIFTYTVGIISGPNPAEVRSGLEAGTPYAASGSFVLKSELGKGSAEHSH